MKTIADLEIMVLEMPEAYKDYPFGEGVAVYKVRAKDRENGEDLRSQILDLGESQEGTTSEGAKDVGDKMFAIIDEKSSPVRLSLKCDPQLAILLRDKYESVLPGYHLNKKHWNTLICSGQVDDDELRDLIRHSYELVTAAL